MYSPGLCDDGARDERASFVMRAANGDRVSDTLLFESNSLRIIDRVQAGREVGLGTDARRRRARDRLPARLALRLISEGERDLTTVAMESGFSTHSHMSATFQAEMGRTPSAAREKIALP